jgi:hypothetical protein
MVGGADGAVALAGVGLEEQEYDAVHWPEDVGAVSVHDRAAAAGALSGEIDVEDTATLRLAPPMVLPSDAIELALQQPTSDAAEPARHAPAAAGISNP